MRYRVGTCGFAYDDWIGPFYPPSLKREDWLGYYSGIFDTIEIDGTYYGPPNENQTKRWRRVTPDHFRFSLKLFQDCLPLQDWRQIETETLEFIEAIEPLGNRLRWVLVQLPPSASADVNLRHLTQFLDGLEQHNIRTPLAIEFRHPDWARQKDLLARFEDQGVPWVWSEHPSTPPAPEVGNQGYMRFIGDRKLDRFNEIQRDYSHIMGQWFEKLEASNYEHIDIYTNNHFMGFGPGTANQFRSIAGMKQLEWKVDTSKQASLFDF